MLYCQNPRERCIHFQLVFLIYVGVLTRKQEHSADVVVLAAGLNVPKLAEHLKGKVPLSEKPGTLTILTQPMPKFLNHIIVTGMYNAELAFGGELPWFWRKNQDEICNPSEE